MKTIKIKFCDFHKGFNISNNDFVDILSKYYEVVFSDEPDYVFYSVFGKEHMRYNCVRIFYTGECVVPDFNICDYAIGFHYLDFGDRYLRFPLYKLFQYKKEYISVTQNNVLTVPKTSFCTFVCSNDSGMAERKEFFYMLSQYKKVDSGGKYLNNIGENVLDKMMFLSDHKFNIAFENCIAPGYTTEKIVEAFAAGTIPIYYGNTNIAAEFNSASFINCHEYSSFSEVVSRIIEIDQDNNLYNSILNESKVIKNNISSDNDLENFIVHIFDQSISEAKRRHMNNRIQVLEQEQIHLYKWKNYFKLKNKKNSFIRRIKNGSL